MRPRVALSIFPHIWAKAALAFSQLFLRGIISQIQIVGMHRECLRHKSPEQPPPHLNNSHVGNFQRSWLSRTNHHLFECVFDGVTGVIVIMENMA